MVISFPKKKKFLYALDSLQWAQEGDNKRNARIEKISSQGKQEVFLCELLENFEINNVICVILFVVVVIDFYRRWNSLMKL